MDQKMAEPRFEYPFRENYKTIDGVKLHYIDEGQGPVVWLMHGMPMWSYLYRKIIPILVDAGYRCFAPDLMGFGLSEKPRDESAHSLQRHVQMMTELIQSLGLKDITVVGQDWGGPICLRYAIENKDNIKSIILLNTFIERFPANQKERERENMITGPLPKVYEILFKNGGFSSFLVNKMDVFRSFVWMKWKTGNPSKALGAGFRRSVDPRAMQNYRAPHADPKNRAGICAFPKLIPNRADHPNAQYIDQIKTELANWSIPAMVIFPDGDMAWKPDEGRQIAELLHGEFHLINNAGHYLQEDAGEEVAGHMVNFLKRVAPN